MTLSILILTVIGLIGGGLSAYFMLQPGTRNTLFAICMLSLTLSLYFGGIFYSLNTLSHTEIKTVDICDKFTSDQIYNIATSDGNTYYVEYNAYGFIPPKGKATLEFTTNGFTGLTSVTKIISNTTCQAGCES